jgi:hypothetical protein
LAALTAGRFFGWDFFNAEPMQRIELFVFVFQPHRPTGNHAQTPPRTVARLKHVSNNLPSDFVSPWRHRGTVN